MYNLNVNVNPSPTAAAGLLGVAAAEVTPRTPEIVNSLIAMTNPFEGYTNERSRDRTDSTSSGEPSPPSVQHTCSQLIKEGTHPSGGDLDNPTGSSSLVFLVSFVESRGTKDVSGPSRAILRLAFDLLFAFNLSLSFNHFIKTCKLIN